MRIGFLPANVDGAGCYRCIFPMAYLGMRGHEASMPAFTLQDGLGRTVAPYPGEGLLERIPPGDMNVAFYEETIPDADLYVFQLGTHSWMLDWARKLKDRGATVVLDMDDDVWMSPLYNPARLDRSDSLLVNRQNAREMVELADAVTVTTEALAELYGRWNGDVTVLPNRLHWPMWDQVRPVFERRDWRRVRVGYMGGFDYHHADVKTIGRELRRWLIRNPDVEFVAAGDDRFHDLIGVPDGQRVTTRKVWYRNLDLPHVTSAFDIGLVPLVKNRFNEGKSWLKGLEYSACGIVPLASPTQPYREFIQDGVNGFLCERPVDFIERLDMLVADRDLRERMGSAAYAAARASSLDHHIQDWENAYERIVGVGADTDRARAGAAA